MLKELYEKRESDGIKDCFRSDGYIQGIRLNVDNSETISMEEISPFLRTMLITDGTVTKSLEAYYWEPVVVDMVCQTVVIAEKAIEWLKSQAEEEILIREVRLRGVKSGNYYATAFSVIRHHLLPENLRNSLLAGTMGIGVLIRDCGLETYRQVLDVGVKKQKEGVINTNGQESMGLHDFVYRTYRIIIDHQPVIIITESFPCELYV